ncbi:hypothetical protein Dimus_015660, partial [Dionaea muscipula]
MISIGRYWGKGLMVYIGDVESGNMEVARVRVSTSNMAFINQDIQLRVGNMSFRCRIVEEQEVVVMSTEEDRGRCCICNHGRNKEDEQMRREEEDDDVASRVMGRGDSFNGCRGGSDGEFDNAGWETKKSVESNDLRKGDVKSLGNVEEIRRSNGILGIEGSLSTCGGPPPGFEVAQSPLLGSVGGERGLNSSGFDLNKTQEVVEVVEKGFDVAVEEAKLWCLRGDLRNACSSTDGCHAHHSGDLEDVSVGSIDRIGVGIEEVESVQKSGDGECSVDRVVNSVEDGHKLRLLENSSPNFPRSNVSGFPVVITGVVRVFQGDFAKVVCDSRGQGSIGKSIERKKVKVIPVTRDEDLSSKSVGTAGSSLHRSARIHER